MNSGMVQALDGATICALSTAAGMGGIAVIRVSGPEALACVSRVFSRSLAEVESHRVVFGRLRDAEGAVLDECVATVFRVPGSYTG